MRIQVIDGQEYWLPNKLNPFQLEMYVHLINWKWKHITRARGRAGDFEYDAILPESLADGLRVLYPEIVATTRAHHQRFPFRMHTYFNHMASSQAANINLFLPILLHPRVDAILGDLNQDFARLATDHLDQGWRIEFWDEPAGSLADKSATSGTDADMAIAYYDHGGELRLWLIEHKLTEADFTTCGGFASKGRKVRHDCARNFAEIMEDKSICYYHDVRKFNYWNITGANRDFFVDHAAHAQCPFQGGMNQLWRNQLLALAIEQDESQPYRLATFSVVRHPRNQALDKTLADYQALVGGNPKFTTFTSADVVAASAAHADDELRAWIDWYKELYDV